MQGFACGSAAFSRAKNLSRSYLSSFSSSKHSSQPVIRPKESLRPSTCALLEGRGPRDRNGRRASAPPHDPGLEGRRLRDRNGRRASAPPRGSRSKLCSSSSGSCFTRRRKAAKNSGAKHPAISREKAHNSQNRAAGIFCAFCAFLRQKVPIHCWIIPLV
jgi:hypothetical protein